MNAAASEARLNGHDSEAMPMPAPVATAKADRQAWRARYLLVLTWAFTALNSARVLSYLPTLWALTQSGDSSQHSLWTWGLWAAANVTMAAWLYEQQGQRWTRAVAVNLMNATMCMATFIVIAALRL
jgi:hypothetical protein